MLNFDSVDRGENKFEASTNKLTIILLVTLIKLSFLGANLIKSSNLVPTKLSARSSRMDQCKGCNLSQQRFDVANQQL